MLVKLQMVTKIFDIVLYFHIYIFGKSLESTFEFCKGNMIQIVSCLNIIMLHILILFEIRSNEMKFWLVEDILNVCTKISYICPFLKPSCYLVHFFEMWSGTCRFLTYLKTYSVMIFNSTFPLSCWLLLLSKNI